MNFRSNSNKKELLNIEKQLHEGSYSTIKHLSDYLKIEQDIIHRLIDEFKKPVLIEEKLNLKIKYDLLTKKCKLNFITLLCLMNTEVDEVFLEDEDAMLLFKSYRNLPILNTSYYENSNVNNFDFPPNNYEYNSPEYIDFVSDILDKNIDHSKEIIEHYFDYTSLGRVHDLIKEFFKNDRTFESVVMFIRFYICDYIKKLDSTPHRHVVDIVVSISSVWYEQIIAEIFIPIIFDRKSSRYQFNFLGRLLESKEIKDNYMQLIFGKRIYQMDGPCSSSMFKWLTSTIPNLKQIDYDTIKNILFFLDAQKAFNREEVRSTLLFLDNFFKTKDYDIDIASYIDKDQIYSI